MKKITSLFIVAILVFIHASGLITPIKGLIENRPQGDTPIANVRPQPMRPPSQNQNDEWEPDFESFKREIESLGGYTIVADSEVVLERQMQPSQTLSTPLRVQRMQERQQRIIVRESLTGNVLQNAVVWLDGVPRFTNRDGEVRVTLNREIVSLKVERNDFNPHIEYIEVDGQDKIVYLRRPNDDIEIFAVLLEMDFVPVNLFTQQFFVNLDIIGNHYLANLHFYSNVQADEFRFYVGNTVYFSSFEYSVIPSLRFYDSMLGANFYARIVFEGIESRKFPLNLHVIEFVDPPSLTPDQEGPIGPMDNVDSGGIFSGINIDFSKLPVIKDIFNRPNRREGGQGQKGQNGSQTSSPFSLTLNANFNPRTGVFTVNVGVAFSRYIRNRPDFDPEARARANAARIEQVNQQNANNLNERDRIQTDIGNINRELNQLRQAEMGHAGRIAQLESELIIREMDHRMATRNIENANSGLDQVRQELSEDLNEARRQADRNRLQMDSLTDAFNAGNLSLNELNRQIRSLPDVIRQSPQQFSQHQRGVVIGFELKGTFGWNLRYNQMERLSVAVSGYIGFRFEGVFMASFVPMFYTVTIRIGFNAQLVFYQREGGWLDFDRIVDRMLIGVFAEARGEVGAGINGLLSIAFFARLRYTFSGYFFVPEAGSQGGIFFGHQFDWEVGVRVRALLIIDFSFGVGDTHGRRPATPDEIRQGYRNDGISRASSNMNFISFEELQNNILANQVFHGSRPQMDRIGNRTVSSWVEIDDSGLTTSLVYSVLYSDRWSEPRRIAAPSGSDFYHHMYFDGEAVHITWQRITGVDVTSSLEDQVRNSEIYFASFNPITNRFMQPARITNNQILDFAPRFALRENPDDPITIVWQRNSEQNIVGLTGINKVYYSVLDGNSWSEPTRLFESDNYLSFVTSAIIGSELTTSLLLFEGEELFDAERSVIVISGGQNNILALDAEVINNPQFAIVDGKARLFVHADDQVWWSTNMQTWKTWEDVPQGWINDTFKILDTPDLLIIHYETLNEEQEFQVFASILDKRTGEWQLGVQISNEEHKVMHSSIVLQDDGSILALYNVVELVQINDYNEELITLNYTVREFGRDFKIESVFYNPFAQNNEEVELVIGIRNTGDFPLAIFEVSAFGIIDTIILEEKLQIGQQIFIEVNITLLISSDCQIVSVSNGSIIRTYSLRTLFTEVRVSGWLEFDGLNQIYVVNLLNYSDVSTYITLKTFANGIQIKELRVFIPSNYEITKRFEFPQLLNGYFLFFEIDTEIPNLFEIGNNIGFVISGLYVPSEVRSNPFHGILRDAKRWVI